MMRRLVLAVCVLGCSTLAADQAQAQFLKWGANGSVGIRNGLGTYTYVYPNRMNPLANLAVPGSMQNLPNGQIWQGWDGQVHGNLVDPATGDYHAFMHKGPNEQGQNSNNGYLIEPSSQHGPQPRQIQPDFNRQWRRPQVHRRWR